MIVQLDFPEDLLKIIDDEGQARRAKRKPISQIEWLQTSENGIELWNRIGNKREFMHETDTFINNMIRSAYLRDTGGQTIGRPKLGQSRIEIIDEAIRAYFTPQLKRVEG